MFRAPRTTATRDPAHPPTPSTGRPPSPQRAPGPSAAPAPRHGTAAPTLAQSATSAAVTTTTPRGGRAKNASILSFFKKAERAEEALFVGEGSPVKNRGNISGKAESVERFQEDGVASKRRKVSHGSGEEVHVFREQGCTPPPDDVLADGVPPQTPGEIDTSSAKLRNGPFVDESDSDDCESVARDPPHETAATDAEVDLPVPVGQEDPQEPHEEGDPPPDLPRDVPELRRASTSIPENGTEDFADFEGMEDFEEEYEDGEEFLNKRMMQEQGVFDGAFEGAFEGEVEAEDLASVDILGTEPETPATDTTAGLGVDMADTKAVAACPICSVSFEGVSDQEASVHVNHCLDGNPTPLPSDKPQQMPKIEKPPASLSIEPLQERPKSDINADTFKRPSRPAKPGQSNPLTLGQSTGGSSAFSKLMSGHSEEAAFAEAAAREKTSHGQPSYKRTCPFYKILPGFSICVDAFRYGAVEGCKAYFLSHFHSDHYVGLTANWTHGPIFCSGVTGRLAKQQLRVPAKYIVELEWEQTIEVPGTGGVHVTMIPANHCPGSSIFLFEKELAPAGKNGVPKTQRVLHCGDFRACPAHVEHPLLRPDVADKVTGATREQKIDVCYLDTTYLNPKYAFPSQEDVIKACADMCVALDAGPAADVDKFAAMLRDKAGGGMAKFVQAPPPSSDTTGTAAPAAAATATTGRLLVIVGTYSIGKERICLGIARALDSKIYAPPPKMRIIAALRDPELAARMTPDPAAAQVHMTPLFDIRPDTLAEYLSAHAPRFARAVAFRPSGWNFRSPGGRSGEPSVPAVLRADGWASRFGARDLAPARGSSAAAAVFGVPYSEHSSFRELSMFCCALRIGRVIPTVNVGSAVGRARMKAWVERWAAERRRNGLFRVVDDEGRSTWYPGEGTWGLRTTL